MAIERLIERPEFREALETKAFPWEGRSEKGWRRYVSAKEASHLFYLVSKTASENPEWIRRWKLGVPFGIYWGNNFQALTKDFGLVYEGKRLRDVQEYSQKVSEIFSDQRLFLFLLELRRVARERRLRAKLNGNGVGNLSPFQDVERNLGWPPSVIEEMKGRYGELVELFLPRAIKIARGKRVGKDFEEQKSIAGEEITRSVVNFYWETIAIDPNLTVKEFLAYIQKSIQDPFVLVYDTRRLEVEMGNFLNASYSDPTADTAMENASVQEIESLIRQRTKSEVDVKVLELVVFEGKSWIEAARVTGLSNSNLVSIRRRFGHDISKDEDFQSAQRTRLWKDLFIDIEKHRKLFEKKKMTLKMFHRELLEAFFRLNTGEKWSTIDAILKDFEDKGRKINRGSIRRHIARAFNIMNGRERYQALQNRTWNRYQETLLFRKIMERTGFWESLPQRQRRVVERYCSQDSPTLRRIAKEMGINESIVSRDLERVRIAIRQSFPLPVPSLHPQDS